jgi:hypothetical protein
MLHIGTGVYTLSYTDIGVNTLCYIYVHIYIINIYCFLRKIMSITHARCLAIYVDGPNNYMQGWQTSELLLKAILTKIPLLYIVIETFVFLSGSQ